MSSPADQQARLDHVVDGNALPAEMLLQREALRRRIAHAEFQLRLRIEAAIGEIAARLRAILRRQRLGEIFRRELHHVMQRLAPLLAPIRVRRGLRERQSGLRGEALDGFRERDALGLDHEVEDVAVLAGGEAVIELLLVVDRERGRLLLLERRQPLELLARLLQLHAPAHDFRHRKPRFQLIEELRREAHGAEAI